LFKIAVTNMTGARNHGSEALVRCIAEQAREALAPLPIELSLHTEDRVYDAAVLSDVYDKVLQASRWPPRQALRYGLSAALRAYTMAAGTPASRLMPDVGRDTAEADLLIATGGDVFTSDYGYFDKDARVLASGRPIALLGQTIGPFKDEDLSLFQRLTGNIELCTVRETASLAYVNEIAPELKPELTADVAFLLEMPPPDVARRQLEVDGRFETAGRRLVGLSVSAGISRYRAGTSRDAYVAETTAFIDELNRRGWSVVIIPHVQEKPIHNNDLYVSYEVLRSVARPGENVVVASPLLAAEYKGIIGLCDVLVGARTHTTIASLSQGIPTVAVAYSRKAWGIMKDYFGEEVAAKLIVDVKDMTAEKLHDSFAAALANGRTPETAARMKRLALRNFEILRDYVQARQNLP